MGGLRAPVDEDRLSPLVAADSLLEHVKEDFSGLLPEEFITLSPPHGPGISLEGMMLKLKLQYFGHLMRRVNSLEKTLTLGGQKKCEMIL